MILSEPRHQVIVLNSFHLFFSSSPGPLSLVEGSPPERLLFFLIVLYPYYSFLNSSYHLQDPLSSIACCLPLVSFFPFFLLHIRIILKWPANARVSVYSGGGALTDPRPHSIKTLFASKGCVTRDQFWLRLVTDWRCVVAHNQKLSQLNYYWLTL